MNDEIVQATVPANLLFFGEYAVLEKGGLGIACAVEPRLKVTGEWYEKYCITANSGLWHMTIGYDTPVEDDDVHRLFLRRLLIQVDKEIGRRTGWKFKREREGGQPHITIDSHHFFDNRGNKLGLGSSAAVTVAATAMSMKMIEGLKPSAERLFPAALAVHRNINNGFGSGYDVAAALWGGWGLFCGGPEPRWSSITEACQHWPPIYRFSGKAPVATTSAIAAFRRWRRSHREQWQQMLDHSNETLTALVNSRDWMTTRRHAKVARDLARELGESIGVPAIITPPTTLPANCFHKALGAGNELGIAFMEADSADTIDIANTANRPPFALTPLPISSDGLRWQ